MHFVKAAAIAFTLMLALAAIAEADNNGIARVAFFGFQLINTSVEATSPSTCHVWNQSKRPAE